MMRDRIPFGDWLLGSIASVSRDWPILPGSALLYKLVNRPRRACPPFTPTKGDDYEAQERVRAVMGEGYR